jgi:hypothetical protein
MLIENNKAVIHRLPFFLDLSGRETDYYDNTFISISVVKYKFFGFILTL